MENKTYNFKVSNNHILVNIDDEYYVIDTGSPYSFFYNDEKITIDGKEYTSNRQLASRQEVEKLVGAEINGFIGFDIISKTGITVDFLENTIMFDVKQGHICYFLNSDEGYCCTKDCVINGKQLERTIIDSGACISYVNRKFLDLSKKTGETYIDYSPIIGKISGEYYEVAIDKVTLGSGDYHHVIKVGKMTSDMERIGVDAFIGLLDIIKDEEKLAPNKTVSIDIKKNILYIL